MASDKVLAAALARGECVALHKGREVYMDDVRLPLVLLRPEGEVLGYWAMMDAIYVPPPTTADQPPPAPTYKPSDQRELDRLINNQR